jgi:hypothetical protein
MSDVFYGGGGKKKLDVFFPAKKAVDERWEVVNAIRVFCPKNSDCEPAKNEELLCFVPKAS